MRLQWKHVMLSLMLFMGFDVLSQHLEGSFVSKFDRYVSGETFSGIPTREKVVTAWKGERVSIQLFIWSDQPITDLTYQLSDFTSSSGEVMDAENIKILFPAFVKGDPSGQTCRAYSARDSTYLIADLLSTEKTSLINKSSLIPIWISMDLPSTTEEGLYKGTLQVAGQHNSLQFQLDIEVLPHELPNVRDWKFHLDLWQYPTLSLEHYNNNHPTKQIELWSDDHFALIKPAYEILADAGQKAITAHIKQNALGEPSMVNWTLKSDGSWEYDFLAFDRFVGEMMNLGIDGQINCFSPVGWNEDLIPYFEESSDTYKILTAPLGSAEYAARWDDFLSVFREHLIERGWFNKTVLYLDEVSESKLNAVVEVVKGNDTNWKLGIAYARSFKEDSKAHFYDLSGILESASNTGISDEKISTFYTSCTQEFPNSYVTVDNDPSEMVWMAYHALRENYDGFLRWAYDNWKNNDPRDLRDGSNTAGDFAFIYRADNDFPMTFYSSIRLEMLREGIEDFEKYHVLAERYGGSSDPFDQDALKELEGLTSEFNRNSGSVSRSLVEEAQKTLDNLAKGDVPYCRAGSNQGSQYYLSKLSSEGAIQNLNYVASAFPERGYDRSSEAITIVPGSAFMLTLQVNVDGLCYNSQVWIDWNLNETFEENELVEVGTNLSNCDNGNVMVEIVVPENLPQGIGRMRIKTSAIDQEGLDPCGLIDDASFLDFDLLIEELILSSSFSEPNSELIIYPNPTNKMVELKGAKSAHLILYVFSIDGREIFHKEFRNVESQRIEFSTDGWEKGTYILKLTSKNSTDTLTLVVN